MSAEKGAGDLGEEKKGGPLDSLSSFALFSPSLPFLRLPHSLPLIVFFVEIWQSGRGRPPASYQLTRMYAICVCHRPVDAKTQIASIM